MGLWKVSKETIEELFPYSSFGVRLEIKDENRLCWFKDDYDLQKYLTRYKLDKRKIKVDYRDGEPVKPGKTNKTKVRQGTTKSSSGSASGSRGSTKKLDPPGVVNRTRKPKSK
jgi:hypothetical protein